MGADTPQQAETPTISCGPKGQLAAAARKLAKAPTQCTKRLCNARNEQKRPHSAAVQSAGASYIQEILMPGSPVRLSRQFCGKSRQAVAPVLPEFRQTIAPRMPARSSSKVSKAGRSGLSALMDSGARKRKPAALARIIARSLKLSPLAMVVKPAD